MKTPVSNFQYIAFCDTSYLVAFINSCSPNLDKAVERINRLSKHLSDREMMYVMSLLVFDKIIDMVKDSDEFKSHVSTMKERTVH